MMNWHNIELQHIQQALELPYFDALQAQQRMAPMARAMLRPPERPGSPRMAAVLILLFPGDEGLQFVLTRRHDYPGVHGGQISLPGGQREGEEAFEEAALRETFEEVGVPSNAIQLLGQISNVYIPPSDFFVYPYVGYTPSRPIWQPDPAEVAEVLEVSLYHLFDDGLKRSGEITRNGATFPIKYYALNGHMVWGATAVMLSEFEGRLRAVLSLTPKEIPIDI
ncbi:MAG: coenzyme A pyrophosphatase [Chloroflexi bacterium]|nr:coenzyme A pyrophosphatase [Chloroflexota bacterium]